jgi:hypothetical protein
VDFDAIMARLADATDAELGEALTAINQAAAELRTAAATEENVNKLEALAAARQTIAGEQTKRTELAARQSAAAAAFADDTDADDADADRDPLAEAQGVEQDDDAETDAESDADAEQDDADADNDGTDAGGTVTASGRKPGRRKLGGMTAQQAGTRVPKTAGRIKAVTRVQGGIPGFEAGARLDRATLAQAFAERFNTLKGTRDAGRFHVARVEYAYPESRQLSATDWATNTARIEAATGPEAIVAAGGLCAPLETLYDIQTIGVTRRPLRDALTRFGVDRGGIQYRQPFDALTMNSGLGVWTLADDEAVGVVEDPDVPDPTKSCFVVDCPGVEEATIYSTYLCMEFPNITARFDREWVDATTRSADVAWARFAENQLLARLLAGSKHLTAVAAVSAVRDMLVNLDKTIAYYRNRHRLDDMVPLRLILPRWVKELWRADLTRGFAGELEALAVADATIESWFRARGVNITFHLDGLNADATVTPNVPAQNYANVTANSTIPPFINRVDGVLYAEGDWLFLDGGTLDLGLVRDSGLNARNRYRQFQETFEGAAFRGIETLRLNMEVQPTGASVGTISTAFTD